MLSFVGGDVCEGIVGKILLFLEWNTTFWVTCNLWLFFRDTIHDELRKIFSIVHPIFHRTKVTKARLVKCLIVLWLSALALTFFTFYRPDVISKLLSLQMSLSMAALVFIYVRIYIACTRSSKIFGRKNRINPSSKNQDTFETQRRDYLRNLRLVKSCFMVVVCFGICFLPGALVISGFQEMNEDLHMIRRWSEILLVSNSSLNSLIFFWRNKLLRREAQKILKQLLC